MLDGNPERQFSSTIRHSSAGFWGAALRVELTRVEEGQRVLIEHQMQAAERSFSRPDSPARTPTPVPVPQSMFRNDGVPYYFEQSADCHFLLIAVSHIHHIMSRLRTGSTAVEEAAQAFETDFPGARDLRNILEHLEDYEAGRGRLQRRNQTEPTANALFLLYESGIDPTAEVHLHFGPGERTVPLKATARAAIEIAILLEECEEEPDVPD